MEQFYCQGQSSLCETEQTVKNKADNNRVTHVNFLSSWKTILISNFSDLFSIKKDGKLGEEIRKDEIFRISHVWDKESPMGIQSMTFNTPFGCSNH